MDKLKDSWEDWDESNEMIDFDRSTLCVASQIILVTTCDPAKGRPRKLAKSQ